MMHWWFGVFFATGFITGRINPLLAGDIDGVTFIAGALAALTAIPFVALTGRLLKEPMP